MRNSTIGGYAEPFKSSAYFHTLYPKLPFHISANDVCVWVCVCIYIYIYILALCNSRCALSLILTILVILYVNWLLYKVVYISYTGWSKSICAPDDYSTKNTQKYSILDSLITEHIRNVDRAILNTVFEKTVRRVNKCLETGGGHFEHYL